MSSKTAKQLQLLVVDDDAGLQRQLKWLLSDFEVLAASSREEALVAVRRFRPAVVLQDLGLPPDPAGLTEGLQTVQDILAIAPHTKVIVVTGNGDQTAGVKSVGLGAWDFYAKPFDAAVLRLIIDRAFHVAALEAEHRARRDAQVVGDIEGIVAVSDVMLALCRKVEKLAPVDVSVLLRGESGTGKELVARALHSLSGRRERRFVAINCAAIPEALLESELFGFERGAYTGAAKTTPGKIEIAEGGTLFLDEIGDMPLPLQAKLLRFLQGRVIERLGGRREIAVDVRVVCATHQDLQALIPQGRFRADLYYRVNEVTVEVPPLRERQGCIPALAQRILARCRSEQGRERLSFAPGVLEALAADPWPGNVRELESRIKSAVIMAAGPAVTVDDLALQPGAGLRRVNLREVRGEAEKAAVRQALALAQGNISRAAELLGATRPTVYRLMERFGLDGAVEDDA
jgi:two-component system NtrC family response regulator